MDPLKIVNFLPFGIREKSDKSILVKLNSQRSFFKVFSLHFGQRPL